MFQLFVRDIHPGQQAGDKEEAIRQVATILTGAGDVADDYANGMLTREQQTSTLLGNEIAILHGTTDTRNQALKTGVQIFQFLQDVTWGEGQTAYTATGIAASSDEHLDLLCQLARVLSDDVVAVQLQSATTAEELHALLMGEKQSEALKLDNETLSLDVAVSDLLTLRVLNTTRLKEVGIADTAFASHAISDTPPSLGQGAWLNGGAEGNLRNTAAVSRAANAFTHDDQPVSLLVTVAIADEQSTAVLNRLSRLLLDKKADHLLKADAATVLALSANDGATAEGVLGVEFAVRNGHGLHVRSGTMPANTVKQLSSDVTVTNFDGSDKPANGRSLTKIVVLGVEKGHRLRFIAQGEGAQQTLDAVGEATTASLGEGA